MKIFLTGSNSRQCGTARLHNKRVFDALNLCNMMRTFADVDFKPASSDVNIDSYDFSIVGFGALGSSTYPNMMQALNAIGRARKCVVYLEDWKTPRAVVNEVARIYNKGYDTFLAKTFNKAWSDGARFYKGTDGDLDPELSWHGLERLMNSKHELMYLIPAFSWGDKSIVTDVLGVNASQLMWFDETPWFIEQQGVKDIPYNPDRAKRFFYCGLSNQDSWLKKNGIKDKTDCWGCKPYDKIETEAEVNQKHNEYLGIAIPEYYHAGSGWLRFRYIYGAFSKNVFMIGDKDAKALGITPVKDFDAHTDSELEDIAMATYEAVKSKIPEKQDAIGNLRSQLEKIL